MILSDLRSIFNLRDDLLEMRVEDSSLFKKGDMVSIDDKGDYCMLSPIGVDGNIGAGCGANFVNERYRSLYAGNKYSFCQVYEVNGDVVVIEFVAKSNVHFDDAVLFAGAMTIAVVDEPLRSAPYNTVQEFNDFFQQNYSLKLGSEIYFIFGQHIPSGENDEFIIVDGGRKKYYSVSKMSLSELEKDGEGKFDEKIFVIRKNERPLCDFDNWAFSLHRTPIHITDKTIRTALVDTAKQFSLKGGEKYIKLWSNYAEAEKRLSDKWLMDAGDLQFSSLNAYDEQGDYEFSINPGSNITRFEEVVEKHFDGRVVICNGNGRRFASGEIVRRMNAANKIVIRVDRDMYSEGGIIKPDDVGSRINYERREKAMAAIMNGESKNPCVSLIINGRYPPNEKERPRMYINEQIISEIFGSNGANERQREAIDAALNTPDVLVIQGPPGTGKTKVIRAILAHFQKYEGGGTKGGGDHSAYLVTAYQREATRNIVKDMRDDEFGLPVFSYTEIAARGEEDENQDRLEAWCEECKGKVKDVDMLLKKRDGKKFVERIRRLQETFEQSCSLADTVCGLENMVAALENHARENSYVSGDILDVVSVASDLCNKYKKRLQRSDGEKLCSYLAAIPTATAALADGGDVLTHVLFQLLGDEAYTAAMGNLLDELKELSHKKEYDESDAKALARLRVEMAISLRRNEILDSKDRKEICRTLGEIADKLDVIRLTDKQQILLDYVESLEATDELKDAIKKLRAVDAATHQKTLSKYLNGDKDLPEYTSILVDEAARSCPADLMIPIACSKERIILVGDEKQLPQFIDGDTLGCLKDMLDGSEIKALREQLKDAGTPSEMQNKSLFSVSMFEYMISISQELTRRDSEKRTRLVMLNEQYRMPPVLGDFVSRVFYNGELHNGVKPVESFTQHYPLIDGLNMMWLEVSGKLHGEKIDDKKSYYREREVDAIKIILTKICGNVVTENDRRKEMRRKGKADEDYVRIGIITGYNAQRRLIENKLRSDVDLSGLIEYIEVGTVDSFQGKEFDIVILSAVRTDKLGFWNIHEKAGEWEMPRAGMQRTCVAFSRAKKCMIVVASELFRSPEARKNAPAFDEFFSMCYAEKQGVCKAVKFMIGE